MTESLQVEIAETNHAWSVVVHGEVDIQTAAQLSDALETAIARGARLIALDLEGVDFLDSSGLRVIVTVADELRAADGSLFLQGASPAVLQVLELTGLIAKLRRSTLDEA